jgi:Cof subfamily protein (haloacid dehalogenase superfamily)
MLLYISDLDGTLLTSRQVLSEYTVRTINGLIEEGLHFSIATARSHESAGPVIEPLRLQIPIILNNGVFLYDPIIRKNLIANLLDQRIAYELIAASQTLNVSPIVYATNDDGDKKVYYQGIRHKGEAVYIHGRLAKGDRRFTLVSDFKACSMREVMSVVWIGDRDTLEPLYDQLKSDSNLMCHFTQDIYSNAFWLEITNPKANKRWAVEYLKNYLGVQEVACFGDNLNDLPMFEIADQKYAVSNGHPSLKQAATRIIGDHDEDGVARYLQEHYRRKQLA